MAEGRGRERWAHTSMLCAVIANAHRGPKQKAYKPGEFNPYENSKGRTDAIEVTPETLPKLRMAFTGKVRKAKVNHDPKTQ